jgi:DNA primase
VLHDEFRRALEAIKLRAPIEDVVRERVPGLRKAGRLWVACCPFHEERTPSFKVDPERATWHCFGACSTGGDVIRFVEKCDNVPFREAVEILAARTGIDLPRRGAAGGGAGGAAADELAPARAALEEALRFFRAALDGPEGHAAVRYLEQRGLSRASAEAFGLGWAPASGQALPSALRAAGLALEAGERAGLVRRDDGGRAYGFFRGRLTIPIRDQRGRVVGFGARRIEDGDESGPKYVNTPETPLFHKGSLVYGLDRALEAVRAGGHAILVEGYTDVIAAHQAGVRNVVAVLGTATTEEHAALLRRAGARRASLVFDGDEAGRRAAWRALHGLLPLEIELEVATLEGGVDPCDVCVRGGAPAFLAHVEHGRTWLEFAAGACDGLRGVELSRAVDRVLELVLRLPKPVHRDELVSQLAARLVLSPDTLRAQLATLAPARGERRAAAEARIQAAGGAPREGQPDARARQLAPDARELVLCFEELTGALLADPALLPAALPWVARCPDPGLARILQALAELRASDAPALDESAVLSWLGEDPARERVVPLAARARAAAEDDWPPQRTLEEQLARLEHLERQAAQRRLAADLRALEARHMERGEAQAAQSDPHALEIARRLSGGARHFDARPSDARHSDAQHSRHGTHSPLGAGSDEENHG